MVALKVPTPGTSRSSTRLPVGNMAPPSSPSSDGSRNSSTISAAGKVTPSSFEVAGFLDLAAAHRHVGDDGLADIGLPDAHLADAVFRYPRRIHQPGVQGEGAGPGGEVAAVAAPVDEGLVDGDLAVEVVDVMARLAALREDHALAGAGGGAAHPVDVRGIGVGTADHPHEQPIARLAGDPAGFRQVFQAEEHALAGAAAQVGGGDADLGWVGHASSSSAIEFRGSGCVRQPLPVVGG